VANLPSIEEALVAGAVVVIEPARLRFGGHNNFLGWSFLRSRPRPSSWARDGGGGTGIDALLGGCRQGQLQDLMAPDTELKLYSAVTDEFV
jgi:hypothetical protein